MLRLKLENVFQTRIDKLSTHFESVAEATAERIAAITRSSIILAAPSKTGRLRATIQSHTKREGNKVLAVVTSDSPYALIQDRGGIIDANKEYMVWDGKDGVRRAKSVRIRPTFYIDRGFKRAHAEYGRILQEEIQKVTR